MGKRKGGLRAALALMAIVFASFAAAADARQEAAPKPLSNSNGVSRYMAVLQPAVARAAPSASARVVARLSTRTPEGTTNVVLALSRVDRGGQLWIRARLPVLPNNTTGWIRRDSLGGYNTVNTHLVVSISRFTATLYRFGKPVFSARVGVGQSRWPTPTGRFYIRNKLTRYSSPVYGPLAFGTSARSAVLTDWPAGGFVGIHGTNAPGLIPGRISHGCIRLRNADILRLAELMPPGTPLTIV